MKSIDFEKANFSIAKDQPGYNTLYAHYDLTDPKMTATTCFELTDEDIEQIIKTRKLWVMQYTFGNLYAPMSVQLHDLFPGTSYETPMDENRTPANSWDETHFRSPEVLAGSVQIHAMCHNCGKSWLDHFYSSRQCEVHQ